MNPIAPSNLCLRALALASFALLLACSKPIEVRTTAPSSPPPAAPVVVEAKSAGPDVVLDRSAVMFVQRILASLGYDVGNPDGVAGPATRRAILSFQKDQKLAQDGLITASLIEKLKGIQAALPKTTNVAVSAGDTLFFSDGSIEVAKEERVLQWLQRDKRSLVAARPSTALWPSAARAGLDWATSHALDLNNGNPTFWTSTGVDRRFEIRTLALTTQEQALFSDQAARCRKFELRSYTPQRVYPAIACVDGKGTWHIARTKVLLARPASTVGDDKKLAPPAKSDSGSKR